jgi:hypothetical protein
VVLQIAAVEHVMLRKTSEKNQLDSTPDVDTDHMLKQRLAAPGRYYGNGGTIHGTGHVVRGDGQSWQRRRCLVSLPTPSFQTNQSRQRMHRRWCACTKMYIPTSGRKLVLTGVEIQ